MNALAYSLCLAAALVAADDPAPPNTAKLLDDPLAESPERLVTKRSEAEEDRLTATAHFAAGRLRFQRQDFAASLARYERAWRYSPDQTSWLAEIVTLANSLGRKSEAARYAIIAAERDSDEPALLDELAVFLQEQKEWPRAQKLFEKSLALRKADKPDTGTVLTNLEIGKLSFLNGDNRRSAEAFAQVLDAVDHPEKYGLEEKTRKAILSRADRSYLLWGEAFLHAGQLDKAEIAFRRSNDAKSAPGLLALQLARVEELRGKHTAALKKLDEYFASGEPATDEIPYELLETLLRKTLSADQAERELLRRLEQQFKADPANSLLGEFVGARLRKANELDRAQAIYERMLKREPSPEAFAGSLDVLQRRSPLDREQLLTQLGKAVGQFGFTAIGKPALAIAADPKLSAELIELAKRRQAKPETADKGVALAAAHLALEGKRYDAAQELFDRALQAADASDRTRMLESWAIEMLGAAQYDQAAKTFQRVVDLKPKAERAATLNFLLSGALAMGGKTDEALQAIERADQLNPKSARIRARTPWILNHAKRYVEAEQKYREVLKEFDKEHGSDDVRETLRDARMALSNLCAQAKRMPEAEEWLEQVLDEFPEDIGAHNDLGYLWAEQGKHLQRALAMTQKAVEHDNDNAAYRDSLGWVLYRLGRFEEAIKELEKATAEDDPDGVLLDHLGDGYLGVKQPEKAIAAWNRAVKAFESSKDEAHLAATREKIRRHSPGK